MPTPEMFEVQERYLKTGICQCGAHESEHGANLEEVQKSPLKCSLYRDDVSKWCLVRQQQPPV